MKKILILLMLLFLPFGVMAEEYETSPIETIDETQQTTTNTTGNTTGNVVDETTTGENTNNPADIPYTGNIIEEGVTVDDLGDKVIDKLEDVVDLLKKIAAPLSIIMFIVGAILMVLGAFGKRDGISKGIIVCILSIIMYSLCMYAGPIISAVNNWLIS